MKNTFIFCCAFAAAMVSLFGCTPKKVIALTFDDGPTSTTPAVLDILEEYDIPASFFLIGDNINDSTVAIIKRTVGLGCEICNHSKSHPAMAQMAPEAIKAEIDYTSDKIREVVGYSPKFFRPPYISLSDVMYETIELPFICGIGAEDWVPTVSAEERASRVLKQARDGEIILLHDFQGNDNTVEALKTIVPELLKQGYKFVTVSELFKIKKVTPTIHEKKIYSYVPQTEAQ